LPSWLLPKSPLSVAQKCLLDVYVHAAGEFLLKHDPSGSEAVAECMGQARERIATQYPRLSAAQRDQVRDFYATFDGRDLLDLIATGAA
jgi:hypothetical protein